MQRPGRSGHAVRARDLHASGLAYGGSEFRLRGPCGPAARRLAGGPRALRKRYSFVLRKRYSALKKRSAFANEGRIPGRKGCSLRERCFARRQRRRNKAKQIRSPLLPEAEPCPEGKDRYRQRQLDMLRSIVPFLRPGNAKARLLQTHCTGCGACTEAVALNAASELRLLTASGPTA